MNRRQLLAGALAGAAVLTSNLAFAVDAGKRRKHLRQAWERAASAGKPLLVVVVPKEYEWQRGRRLGIWLNNASDRDLAPLANVEMACATLDELAKHAPGVEAAEGAWLVLVRPDPVTPTWRSVIVPGVPARVRDKSFEDFSEEFTASHGKNPDWGVIQSAYRKHQKQVATGRLEAELEVFRASIGRVLASEGLTEGPTTKLAQQARERWVKKAPPGAHWASSWGCGTTVEPNADDDPLAMRGGAVGCGMGHVEAYAARFLYFWADA